MDKPILFSGPMVRALLNGSKTQTRRIAPLREPSAPITRMVRVGVDAKTGRAEYEMKAVDGQHVYIRSGPHTVTPLFSPSYAVGDRLYVREAWRVPAQEDRVPPRDLDRQIIGYEADCGPGQISATGKFRQAMHMPRWASRLTLTVTDVRVERLQDISEEDARSEGIIDTGNPLGRWKNYLPDAYPPGIGFNSAVNSYATLWNSINGHGSWDANPWVAAYTFTVQRGNIDQLAGMP